MPRPRGGVLGGATRRQRAGGGPEIAKSSAGLILTRFTRALRARSTTVRERPMNRCALSVLAASTVLTVLGCSERERGLPAPQFHDIVVTATSTCDFDAVSHLANHYFSPPLQQLVQDSVGLMQSSGAFSEDVSGGLHGAADFRGAWGVRDPWRDLRESDGPGLFPAPELALLRDRAQWLHVAPGARQHAAGQPRTEPHPGVRTARLDAAVV